MERSDSGVRRAIIKQISIKPGFPDILSGIWRLHPWLGRARPRE